MESKFTAELFDYIPSYRYLLFHHVDYDFIVTQLLTSFFRILHPDLVSGLFSATIEFSLPNNLIK